jgi:hypothetical protein
LHRFAISRDLAPFHHESRLKLLDEFKNLLKGHELLTRRVHEGMLRFSNHFRWTSEQGVLDTPKVYLESSKKVAQNICSAGLPEKFSTHFAKVYPQSSKFDSKFAVFGILGFIRYVRIWFPNRFMVLWCVVLNPHQPHAHLTTMWR